MSEAIKMLIKIAEQKETWSIGEIKEILDGPSKSCEGGIGAANHDIDRLTKENRVLNEQYGVKRLRVEYLETMIKNMIG